MSALKQTDIGQKPSLLTNNPIFIFYNYMVAAEQKARSTYENILRLVHDSDVCEPIRFLRAREIVHFQRFGEANRTDLSKSRTEIKITCYFISIPVPTPKVF